MAYMQCPECKLTVPATATYLRGDQCPALPDHDGAARPVPVAGRRRDARAPDAARRGTPRLSESFSQVAGRTGYPCRPPCADISSSLPLLLAVFAFAACGDDSSSTDESAATPAATEAATEAPDRRRRHGRAGRGQRRGQGHRQARLGAEDQGPVGRHAADRARHQGPQGGKGERPPPGRPVDVQYAGALLKDGTKFDASWDRGGEPFSFPLGQGQVIPGWDQGVDGHEGGRPARAGRSRPTSPTAPQGSRPRSARTRRSSSSSTCEDIKSP